MKKPPLDFKITPTFNTWWDANFRRLSGQPLYSKAAAIWNAALTSSAAPAGQQKLAGHDSSMGPGGPAYARSDVPAVEPIFASAGTAPAECAPITLTISIAAPAGAAITIFQDHGNGVHTLVFSATAAPGDSAATFTLEQKP